MEGKEGTSRAGNNRPTIAFRNPTPPREYRKHQLNIYTQYIYIYKKKEKMGRGAKSGKRQERSAERGAVPFARQHIDLAPIRPPNQIYNNYKILKIMVI